jgi:2-dehydro-3-deoxygalactonokinase
MKKPRPPKRSVPAHFVSCDWGTTSFRLRLARTDDAGVLEEITSADGVKETFNHLPPNCPRAERERAFRTVLQQRLAELRQRARLNPDPLPIVISGMASSSVGWRELPYAPVPFSLDGSTARVEPILPVAGQGHQDPVWLMSGVATTNDMMRGEETELMGLMSQRREPTGAEIVVMPGTHSKHIQIRRGAIVDFQTYLTGELFAVLCEHSLLRVSVTRARATDPKSAASDQSSFREGAKFAADHGLPPGLFKVRARSVLDRLPARTNRSFLSGLLIGSELADLNRGKGKVPILLAATGVLAVNYRWAAEELGLGPRLVLVKASVMKNAAVRGQARWLSRQRNPNSP